jgi:MtN3 and saliva related transmembrane protein
MCYPTPSTPFHNSFMQLVDIVGFGAMLGSTFALIPQIIKIYTSKSAKDVSLLSAINFFISGVLWVIYGLMVNAWSVWLTNIFVTCFALILLRLKLAFNHQ